MYEVILVHLNKLVLFICKFTISEFTHLQSIELPPTLLVCNSVLIIHSASALKVVVGMTHLQAHGKRFWEGKEERVWPPDKQKEAFGTAHG